jgi:hypothetical protein
MSRKTSAVSTAEEEQRKIAITEFFEDAKGAKNKGVSKDALQSFAERARLIDSKLNMGDVMMAFQQVKLGKKTEINKMCFEVM